MARSRSKHRRDPIEGRSKKEVLESRRDLELAREIAARLIDEYAAMLTKRCLLPISRDPRAPWCYLSGAENAMRLPLIPPHAAEQGGGVLESPGLLDQLLDIHGDLDGLGDAACASAGLCSLGNPRGRAQARVNLGKQDRDCPVEHVAVHALLPCGPNSDALGQREVERILDNLMAKIVVTGSRSDRG